MHNVSRYIFLVLLITLVHSPTGAKTRYNVWAKEKVRYHHERVQKDPYNAELRVLLGNAYFADGDYIRASAEMGHAIELDSLYAEAYCNLGIVLQAQSRRTEAERAYRRALDLDSFLVEAMAGLGTLLCRSLRHGEGIDYLAKTIELDGRRDDARFNLGVAYHRVGDYRRAVAQLEILRERHFEFPGSARALSQAYFARGLVLFDAELIKQALTFFDKSSDLREHADVRYAMGLAHLKQEDLVAAEYSFARAIELEPDHVPALHNLAVVYEQTDRPHMATPLLNQVVQLTPHLATIDAARNATYDETVLME
ncbi:MAG TPA: tetratricopeptide repeat protein [Candidatus Latescibacteria bacterium]|jgi:tetratricopeptide (TPR) repeat protein|nr:hypothetical protein [Gemmatimonadota bacterium]MDP7365260.1 tetratricopeptide repeat protein [Candidatus Latescibacterota bacterium]MDP7635465.1 tetratricopeptide repeat protein [Candidatus Latescibacterota bacterium]HJN28823.1 tetratricopeptide repeat protein [Candidatus Latescibacterota bacterium]